MPQPQSKSTNSEYKNTAECENFSENNTKNFVKAKLKNGQQTQTKVY